MKVSLFLGLMVFALPLVNLEAKTFREKLKERIEERRQQSVEPQSKTQSFVIEHGGLERTFLVHVPASYSATKNVATPLVVALHGGGGNMNYQADDKLYKLISKSEESGFIVAFPNGYSKRSSGKLATWNAGKCCGGARDKKSDDVGFIKAMLTKISSDYNIDKNKIFATGMSNGGMMSYRLACEMSDTFKAIAPVAGTDNTIECLPKNPISVLHIHALDDDHVLFNGGAGKGSLFKSAVNDFTSVKASISKWVAFNGCDGLAKRILEKSGVYCDLYSQCKNNVEVQLCVTSTGGHSWPGGEKNRGNGSPSQVISANDVMWEFFKK